MSAYLIVHRREITDPAQLKAYRNGVDETISRYGGKIVVRADGFQVLEGDWQPGRKADDSEPERITVLQFPDVQRLRQWYDSADYARLKDIRQSSSRSDVVIVEGK